MITTERLILRPFTENDAADLFEYLHEPMVHCFFDMKISSMDETKEDAVKRMENDCYFAIELKDTGKVIGEIFVHPDGEGMEEEDSEGGYSDDTYSPCWILTGSDRMTLASGLYSLQATETSGSWPVFAAASLVVSFPVLVIFFLSQKYMVSGLTSGGVKG